MCASLSATSGALIPLAGRRRNAGCRRASGTGAARRSRARRPGGPGSRRRRGWPPARASRAAGPGLQPTPSLMQGRGDSSRCSSSLIVLWHTHSTVSWRVAPQATMLISASTSSAAPSAPADSNADRIGSAVSRRRRIPTTQARTAQSSSRSGNFGRSSASDHSGMHMATAFQEMIIIRIIIRMISQPSPRRQAGRPREPAGGNSWNNRAGLTVCRRELHGGVSPAYRRPTNILPLKGARHGESPRLSARPPRVSRADPGRAHARRGRGLAVRRAGPRRPAAPSSRSPRSAPAARAARSAPCSPRPAIP